MESEFEYKVRVPATYASNRGIAYADHWAHCPRTRCQASMGRYAYSDNAWLKPLQDRISYAIEKHAIRPRWLPNDIAILDNWTVLHGRDGFPMTAEREIRACFGYASWLFADPPPPVQQSQPV
jgi:hypothetical protein